MSMSGTYLLDSSGTSFAATILKSCSREPELYHILWSVIQIDWNVTIRLVYVLLIYYAILETLRHLFDFTAEN
jgi:hypothetical protein